MTDTTKPEEKVLDAISEATGVIAKLLAHKAANAGTRTLVLPATNVTVTFPEFVKHGTLMKAQRLAKGDATKASDIYITLVCKFDGERLTLEDLRELIPAQDAMTLSAEVMGDAAGPGPEADGKDGDDEGNADAA